MQRQITRGCLVADGRRIEQLDDARECPSMTRKTSPPMRVGSEFPQQKENDQDD